MDKATIIEAIQEFCENDKSRKRKDLYDFLNEELGLHLDVSIYEKTKFASDPGSQKWEAEHILNILDAEDEYGDEYDEDEYGDEYDEDEYGDEYDEDEYEKTRRHMRNMRNMRNYN